MPKSKPRNVTEFKPKELTTPVPTEPTVESVMAPIEQPQQPQPTPAPQPAPEPTQGQQAWMWLVEILNNTRGLPCTIAELQPRMEAIRVELNELRAIKENQ